MNDEKRNQANGPKLVERALRIVEDALELHGKERRALIEQRCAGDAALEREVESILAHETGLMVEPGPASPPDAADPE